MGELLLHIVELLAGAPAAGIGAAALIYAVYRMARHQLLLFGSVSVSETDHKRYKYKFFVQNLEEFSFPWKSNVLIRDMRPAAENGHGLSVDVYAGPRDVESRTIVRKDARGRVESYWEATFESLSPFDTWTFVCQTESTWLRLEMDTDMRRGGSRPRLIPDVSPRTLGLDAVHPSRRRFKGSTITPSFDVLVATMIGIALIYVSAITYMERYEAFLEVSEFGWRWYDLLVVACLMVILWLGYKRIQRPVYPIMQGYLFQTRPRLHKGES